MIAESALECVVAVFGECPYAGSWTWYDLVRYMHRTNFGDLGSVMCTDRCSFEGAVAGVTSRLVLYCPDSGGTANPGHEGDSSSLAFAIADVGAAFGMWSASVVKVLRSTRKDTRTFGDVESLAVADAALLGVDTLVVVFDAVEVPAVVTVVTFRELLGAVVCPVECGELTDAVTMGSFVGSDLGVTETPLADV